MPKTPKNTDAVPAQVPDKMIAQAIEAMAFSQALGLRVTSLGDGKAAIEMPADPGLVGDLATGIPHGGAVTALMDTCGGAAVMCHPQASPLTATLDLRIDYMRPANAGQTITAYATCYHVTRSVAFMRAEAFDEDPNRPVATATGAFTVDRAATKPMQPAAQVDERG